tara:strand:- start:233 stop:586 length:354 start_codon:yes stop_codon:yes gene_type:complete
MDSIFSKDILIKIYEFNPEHRKLFKKVLDEFFKHTSYWKLNWFNSINKVKTVYYEASYKQITDLCKYWNEDFRKLHPYVKKIKNYNNVYCDCEFITDNNSYNPFFSNYKLQKKYIYK